MAVSIPLSALQPDRRRPEFTEPNPYDKATIFSIYPQEIIEIKRTVHPDRYVIPSGTEKTPSRLVIGSGAWVRDVGIDEPLLEIPISSVVLAQSIVNDYLNSRLASTAGAASPGLFWLPGEISLKELIEKHIKALELAIANQRAWFDLLIKQGDSLWARTNGNPVAIPEDCKIACRELGRTKDWALDFKRMEMEPCPACGQLRNPLFPICASCKYVADPKKAAEMGLVIAK